MCEGYVTITVPAIQKKICAGCQHYSNVFIGYDYDRIYKKDCLHPNAPKRAPLSSLGELGVGNIPEDYTPDWCPVGERKTE